jgi:DNA-binding response OmpR family regulator
LAAANDAAAMPRVLVVSGESTRRDALVRGLAAQGVPVDVAATAAEAGRRAGSDAYHGMTLDLDLPDGRGLGLLADVRAGSASAQAEVKALGLRALSGTHLALAVSDVLPKPLEDDVLARAVWALRPALDSGGPVMVVDDDPAARALMRSALGTMGIEVVTANGGAEAIAMVMEQRPAAIVLDLMMPDVNGFQVLHAIRSNPRTREVPVLIWTALSLTVDEVAQLQGSAQALLAKAGDSSLGDLLEALLRWAREQRHAPDRGLGT